MVGGDPIRLWDPGPIPISSWRRLLLSVQVVCVGDVVTYGLSNTGLAGPWGCAQVKVAGRRWRRSAHRTWQRQVSDHVGLCSWFLYWRSAPTFVRALGWILEHDLNWFPSRSSDRFWIWIWDPGGLWSWDLGQPYCYQIWDPGLWFLILRGRLPSTKFLTPLVGYDFLVFGSSLSGVGNWYWNCWMVHIGYGYFNIIHCLTDPRSVLVNDLRHLVTVLLLSLSDASVHLIIFQIRCFCASSYVFVFYFLCLFGICFCTLQYYY